MLSAAKYSQTCPDNSATEAWPQVFKTLLTPVVWTLESHLQAANRNTETFQQRVTLQARIGCRLNAGFQLSGCANQPDE